MNTVLQASRNLQNTLHRLSNRAGCVIAAASVSTESSIQPYESKIEDIETHTHQKWSQDDIRMMRYHYISPKQVNERRAIDLVAKDPPTGSGDHVVSCDGGGGPLGHPKLYINLDKPGNHICGYCGHRFYSNKEQKQPFSQDHPSTLRLEDNNTSLSKAKQSRTGMANAPGANTFGLVSGTGVAGKAFVQRDYKDGTAVRFETRLPDELRDRIDEQTWKATIEEINAFYAEAETLSCGTFCESCVACLTGYLINICVETRYEKAVRKASTYIERQNDAVFVPRGLMLGDPMDRGLRVIEVCILDTGRSATGQRYNVDSTNSKAASTLAYCTLYGDPRRGPCGPSVLKKAWAPHTRDSAENW